MDQRRPPTPLGHLDSPQKRDAGPTDEIVDRLCYALETAGSVKVACDYAGISKPTYYVWMDRARREVEAGLADTPYTRFRDRALAARSASTVLLAARVQRASEPPGEGETRGDWKAAAWFLERTRPREYAQVRRDMPPPEVEDEPVNHGEGSTQEQLERMFERWRGGGR